MAQVMPFQGVLPAPEYVSRVASLPYDVFTREEARAEASRDPLLFLNIDSPDTQFEASHDMYAPDVYARANELLHRQLAEGIFQQDPERCFYLYELTRQGHTQTGITACVSIDDFLNRTVRKHEATRPEKLEDRMRHIDACSAQTGPIFLAYPRDRDIDAAVAKAKQQSPIFDLCPEDGVRHRGWRISDGQDVDAIRAAFARTDALYIADGHHRAEAAVQVGLSRRKAHPEYTGSEEFNFCLSVLFPSDELQILDYNRVVQDLNHLSADAFLRKVQASFEVSACDGWEKPAGKGDIVLLLGRGEGSVEWYHLKFQEGLRSRDPVDALDVSVLQNCILGPILGIQDPRKDPRIQFVGGIRGLEELEHLVKNGCAAAFALYPPAMDEVFAVADEGRLMPPKSTWFEPKLRSGLFLHLIER